MLKNERLRFILEATNNQLYVTVSELSRALNVSEVTIRRDISELDEQKKLTKVHGGAQKINLIKTEKTTSEKFSLNVELKQYIGKVMNTLIKDNTTLFLGAGTTIYHALPQIQKTGLFIITNNLSAFNYLREHTSHKIILTGGEFYPITEEFIGDIAVNSFKTTNIDIAFGVCNGIFDNNITFAQTAQGDVQNAAFKRAKIKCVIADSTKFDTSDIYTLSHLSDLDYLITDNQLSKTLFQKYSKYTTIIK